MATAPVKSKPLHNFSLPFLKWGGTANKNHPTTSHHRFRRPQHDHPSETDSDPDTRPSRLGSRPPRTNPFSLSPSHHQTPPLDDRDADVATETDHKPWNLRPRKPPPREIGSSAGNGEGSSQEPPQPVTHHHHNHHVEPKSLRLRGFASETQCAEKKEKRKFWIALSREEIEEDIFVMTGSRPARRPRKRPKNVQKQMDSVFPGLWLVGVTADAYRVADTPAKR